MGNYSKAIGSVVGATLGLLVAYNFIPAEVNSVELATGITAIITGIVTWAFPANKPSVG